MQSDNFEIAFNLASDEERNYILLAIAQTDKEEIKEFIDNKIIEGTPFDQMSTRKLRDIAKNCKISGYGSMNKLTLIEEIKNVAERSKENSERKFVQSKKTNSEPKDNVRSGEPRLLDYESYRTANGG